MVNTRVYLWLITLLAFGALAWVARVGPSDTPPNLALAVSLLGLAVLAQHFPLEVGPHHKINVSFAVYVAVVLSFAPAEAVVLVASSQMVGQITLACRRNPVTKARLRGPRGILFNTAQLTLAAFVAAAVYARQAAIQPLAICTAVTAMYVINFLAVETMLVLQAGRIASRAIVTDLIEQLPEFVTLGALGILVSPVIVHTFAAVWLMALPTAAVYFIQRRTVVHMTAERLARIEAERARSDLRLLAGASLQLAESLDFETTLRALPKLTVPAIADCCLVTTLTDGSPPACVASYVDPALMPFGADVKAQFLRDPCAAIGVAQALASRQPVLFPEISDEVLASEGCSDEQSQVLRSLGLRSAMVLPLVASDRLLGAMALYSAKPERRYGSENLWLAEELAGRCALAIENARLYDQERGMVAHLQQLSQQLGAAEREQLLTDERHRMAHELHDQVEQAFFGIGLNISAALDDGTAARAEPLRRSLLEVRTLAAQGAENLRAAIFALSSADIPDRELIGTLWRLVRRLHKPDELEADLVMSGIQRRVSAEVAEALVAIAREGLANVEQHAHASVAILSLSFESNGITLSVQDDGAGVSPLVLNALAGSATRFGLRGIRDRVMQLGGTLTAAPGEDGGFVLRAWVPDRDDGGS